MFTVWGPNGVGNAYRPIPITAPGAVRPIQRDEKKDSERRAWEMAEQDRKKESQDSAVYQKLKKSVSHQKRESIVVEQVMVSPVYTLQPSHRLTDARELVTNKNVSHIPILSEEKELVGIISEKDLLQAQLQSKNKDSTEVNPPIDSFMKSNVISALPSTSIRRVASVMFDEHISAMPVINEEGSLVGIVTRRDILKALVRHAPLKLWA